MDNLSAVDLGRFKSPVAEHLGTNRIKIMFVRPQVLLELFRDWSKPDNTKTLSIPMLKDMPEDVAYVWTFYDAMRDCFGIVLSSDEFDEVPPGEVIPSFTPEMFSVEVNKIQ